MEINYLKSIYGCPRCGSQNVIQDSCVSIENGKSFGLNYNTVCMSCGHRGNSTISEEDSNNSFMSIVFEKSYKPPFIYTVCGGYEWSVYEAKQIYNELKEQLKEYPNGY